ncbi:phosphate ABC transporter substrate-binding protein PstS [Mycobacterium sp. 1164966.3]|uniref:phosphate ABC transporter substrate-binding protein PstS n=1 Tax=Mycobacterium sp. 1164966.3 TaxID=1856861 RepID=UPI0007FB84C8|nr:phosphate ABC transporter substrate-binding protein PstS [Mycobacterium sp. 1164966.3]OBA81529.1 phosphate ABC transporter substrate-binding protein PstS [Mycobacterium sp. 1164966.3]
MVALVVTACVVTGVLLTGCGGGNRRGASMSANSGGHTAAVDCGGKGALSAEGSSAQLNAIELFNQAWSQLCPGKKVSYTASGSGSGREQFIAGHVDFAGADSPLVSQQIAPAAKRCNGHPAWDLPLLFGPVALVYNLPGVATLVVNGDALAKIFSGLITSWNDPTLAALNRGVPLPDGRITPIYRTDPSGTTDNLQRYLTVAAPQSWTQGVGTKFQGGAGQGVASSEGVIRAVRATPGTIGYVEKGFADQAGVPYAQIDNGSGAVPLTNDTARNGASAAKFVASGNDLVLDLYSVYGIHEPNAYPFVLATYQIVCSAGYDADTAVAMKSFLTAAANDGQSGLSSHGYVPLPDKVKERLVTAINAMQ